MISDKSQETVIERRKDWQFINLGEIWAYRELIAVLIRRDVKVRYKQTVLGVTWAVMLPLATMLLFTFVFGYMVKIPSDGYPYPIFLFAALLPWSFFSSSISKSSGSLVSQQQLISKVYFPRLIIPISSVGVSLVDFVVSFLLMLGLMLYFDVDWSLNLLAVPFLALAVIFLALGAGTFLAALTVTYRDFNYVIPFMVQFWMFATPVVYPASIFPEKYLWILYLNPMAGLVEGFRSAILGSAFDVHGLLISGLSAIILFVSGALYFAKVERRFADII